MERTPVHSVGVTAMERATGSAVLGLLCGSWVMGGLAVAQPPSSEPAKPMPKTVYLYGATDLEHLRDTNFDHYLRAQRILADGNKLCRPGPPTVHYAQFDAKDLHCQSLLLMTSNPPKKQLEFQLDDVHYVALITITDDQARLVKADHGR
jgi:hypothetical protein